MMNGGSVSEVTIDSAREKERAARASVLASGGIGLLKLAAGLFTGSLALISEAAHGLLDFGSTLVTWFAVRHSAKPADEEHHYGHGKIESVAALAQTALLAALSVGVLIEAGRRLWLGEPTEIVSGWVAIVVCLVSIGIDSVRWLNLRRVAKATGSIALAADATHFSSDMLGAIGVIAGLLAVEAGFPTGDVYASMIVAIVIINAAAHLGRDSVHQLLDAAPEGAVGKIYGALASVRGISSIQSAKVRLSGETLFAEVAIDVPRTLPQDRVRAIREAARVAIAEVLPNSEATVTAEPRSEDDETVLERVLLIAARRRVPVHHVTVQQISGQLSISLDVEVDGRMTLAAAHRIATNLEEALRDEFGAETEVETHIEPLEAQDLAGQDADAEIRQSIAERIEQCRAGMTAIGQVHSVRVRETDRGLVVSLHVLAEPSRSVEEVHDAVDALERAVKASCPEVLRIVSHAEPIADHP